MSLPSANNDEESEWDRSLGQEEAEEERLFSLSSFYLPTNKYQWFER